MSATGRPAAARCTAGRLPTTPSTLPDETSCALPPWAWQAGTPCQDGSGRVRTGSAGEHVAGTNLVRVAAKAWQLMKSTAVPLA